jgi:hypothetical protein
VAVVVDNMPVASAAEVLVRPQALQIPAAAAVADILHTNMQIIQAARAAVVLLFSNTDTQLNIQQKI